MEETIYRIMSQQRYTPSPPYIHIANEKVKHYFYGFMDRYAMKRLFIELYPNNATRHMAAVPTSPLYIDIANEQLKHYLYGFKENVNLMRYKYTRYKRLFIAGI